MEYREHLPRPELRPWVRCLWRMVADAAPAKVDRVAPDGCAEIVLNRAEAFRRFDDNGDSHVQSEVLLVGQQRSAIAIAPTGTVDLLGIRFEPAGLFALVGAPMHELTGEDLCVDQVVPGLHHRLRETLRVGEEAELLRAVECILLDELQKRRAAPGLAAVAVRAVERGALSTAALAGALGVNRRGLERLFRQEVGLSPKLLIRIRRVQAVLARLDAGVPAGGWAAVAAAHGFADQSHLIRDFRLLVGSTPARYAAERGELAAHF